MSNGYLAYPYCPRRSVFVYHPRSVRLKYCCIQNRDQTNSQPGIGHDSHCTEKLGGRKAKHCFASGELLLHSDQGLPYTSHAYFCLTKEYGITPSMSRRANCCDNAMAENFFSILKSECIYRQKISSFQHASELIDDFIWFYNNQRIQLSTKLTPLEKRRQSA